MYNVNVALEQLINDLETAIDYQKKSLEVLDRVLFNGEKILSPELFPFAATLYNDQNIFVASCMILISSAQFSRNLAYMELTKIQTLASFVSKMSSPQL